MDEAYPLSRKGLRPCGANPASQPARTEAGRLLMALSDCWADWHTGRVRIRREVRELVLRIEAEAMDAA